jgi:hypothetical protein
MLTCDGGGDEPNDALLVGAFHLGGTHVGLQAPDESPYHLRLPVQRDAEQPIQEPVVVETDVFTNLSTRCSCLLAC